MQERQIHFDSTNLRNLIEADNGSIYDVIHRRGALIFEDVTGISSAQLRSYALGEVTPPLIDLMKIATYFAVPLDFLTGRCSQNVAEHILKHYAVFMKELLNVDLSKLERRLSAINEAWDVGPNELTWPYNLMLAVNDGDPFDYLVTDDVMRGIEKALQTLNDRNREIILLRFRDGKTLHEIAEVMGIGSSRVNAIVLSSLRKLRSPNTFFCLMYGCEYVDKNNELCERRAKLETEAQFLKSWEKELDNRLAACREKAEELATYEDAVPNEEQYRAIFSTDLRELGLSTRAYNSLLRALPCCDRDYTFGDVFDLASSGELMQMRNCGKKTAAEILKLIYEKTSISLYEQNGL